MKDIRDSLEALIRKYNKEWNEHGMGGAISYSQVITDLEKVIDSHEQKEKEINTAYLYQWLHYETIVCLNYLEEGKGCYWISLNERMVLRTPDDVYLSPPSNMIQATDEQIKQSVFIICQGMNMLMGRQFRDLDSGDIVEIQRKEDCEYKVEYLKEEDRVVIDDCTVYVRGEFSEVY